MKSKLLHSTISLILAATLAGCHSDSFAPGSTDPPDTEGGATGPTGDSSPPNISFVSPEENSTEVDRTAFISVTFDEGILSTSVTDDSIILTSSHGEITGSTSVDALNNTVTFTPESQLPMLTNLRATTTTSITDLSGNALEANYDWSFTTADGNWRTASYIGNGKERAFIPQIAIDSNGNALAVWAQKTDGIHSIYANRYNAEDHNWGTPILIESRTGGAYAPQIAVDSQGNAIAVWEQHDGVTPSIYANRYTVSDNSWGEPVLIESGNGAAYSPKVAFDSNRSAIAVWEQKDNGSVSIYANHYNAAEGNWGTPTAIETGSGNAYDPQMAFDSNGNAIAVWFQIEGGVESIYANYYCAAGGNWGAHTLLEDGSGAASAPRVAFDHDGNAVAIWTQNDGSADSIYVNHYSAASGNWGTQTLLETGSGAATGPQVAVDHDGNAIAIWTQDDGSVDSIYVNHYSSLDGSWGAQTLLDTSDGTAGSPQVAIDSNGNALAIWTQYNSASGNNIYGNRYIATDGTWGTPARIEFSETSANTPQIAIDSNGNAIAVWQQWEIDLTTNIYTSRFE